MKPEDDTGKLVQLGAALPQLNAVAREKLRVRLSASRCATCPHGGNQKLDWEQNLYVCQGYMVDPDGLCLWELRDEEIPDFHTKEGWMRGLALVLSEFLPELVKEKRMRKACGDTKLTQVMNAAVKWLPAMLAGAKIAETFQQLEERERRAQTEELPVEEAMAALARHFGLNVDELRQLSERKRLEAPSGSA